MPTEEDKKNQPNEEYAIFESNELIRKCQYSLQITQQKLLLHMITKIKPEDDYGQIYSFTIPEFCQAIGLDPSEGYYTILKDHLLELKKAAWWIPTPGNPKSRETFTWLDKVWWDEEDGLGTIKYRFSRDVDEYLFGLVHSGNYTKYYFPEVAFMRSKYSIRLYRLLRSFAFGDEYDDHCLRDDITYDVNRLKKQMDAENYERYYDFKKRALIPAVKEINTYSEDITVSFVEVKRGNTVTNIMLSVNLTVPLNVR